MLKVFFVSELSHLSDRTNQSTQTGKDKAPRTISTCPCVLQKLCSGWFYYWVEVTSRVYFPLYTYLLKTMILSDLQAVDFKIDSDILHNHENMTGILMNWII